MSMLLWAVLAPLGGVGDGLEFFEKRIRPLLSEHCYACHAAGAKKVKGGLRLDSRASVLKGGATGPALVPGRPDESLLLRAVRSLDPDLQMPPKGRLSEAQIADLAFWIERGAPDPREETQAELPTPALKGPTIEEGRAFWAFRPLADVPSPGAGHPVDAFVDSALARAGLVAAPEADREVILRRLTFDLTGLPPTPEERDAFLADREPGAFERVVDRLLDSPHYGERWGRRWLDLVRYADSNGVDEDVNHPHAWRYRDWVIRAFNEDLPYDRFILDQLAGDLLPERGADGRVATSWLAMGPKMLAEPDLEKMRMDIVDEQIDVATKTFMGLTLSCARCHDHKFDPVGTEDYYALAGIFRSTSVITDYSKRPAILVTHVLPDPGNEAAVEAHRGKAAALQAEIASEKDAAKAQGLKERLKRLKEAGPALPRTMGVREIQAQDLPVHLRGSHLSLAKQATPRGAPRVFEAALPGPSIGASQSGRLELARWLADPRHPLTARVMVNRIWQGHFGEGLVRSSSNFGFQGDRPSHPALLDWLAAEFVRRGWSVKAMHRLILTSSAWKRSSAGKASDLDPENRLLAHQNRRRLDAEEIRDALLAASGELDPERGGRVKGAKEDSGYYGGGADLYGGLRRTVYLPLPRQKIFDLFPIFDYADTAVHQEKRPATTVPQQALFMMNHSLVRGRAKVLATRLLEREAPDEERLDAAWKRLFGRAPSGAESSAALRALARFRERGADAPGAWSRTVHALMASNAFLFLE
jgi:mono/diheme cytochrome c family protein